MTFAEAFVLAYERRASCVTIATGPPGPTRVTESTRAPLGEAGAGLAASLADATQAPRASLARARGEA